jgi:hypothetical protein
MKTATLDTLFTGIKTIIKALTPMTPEHRVRALRWVLDDLKIELGPSSDSPDQMGTQKTPPASGVTPPAAAAAAAGGPTPKQFMDAKQPDSDIERVICLAYFLTHHRQVSAFKTKELSALNTEARGRAFSNISMASTNAVRQNNFLAPAGQGKKRITDRGEAVVEALPDREKVKAALSTRKVRRKRARRKAGKSSK